MIRRKSITLAYRQIPRYRPIIQSVSYTHLDIWLGNQLPDHVDRGSLASQRQSHQQAGEELAGDIAAYLDYAAGLDRRWFEVQGRITVVTEIGDVGAQLTQTIDQITDRPLMHSGDPLQDVVTASQR